jgi:hypothetical protein
MRFASAHCTSSGLSNTPLSSGLVAALEPIPIFPTLLTNPPTRGTILVGQGESLTRRDQVLRGNPLHESFTYSMLQWQPPLQASGRPRCAPWSGNQGEALPCSVFTSSLP